MSNQSGFQGPTKLPILWASFGSIWFPVRHLVPYVRAGWLPMLLFALASVLSVYLQFVLIGDFTTVPEDPGAAFVNLSLSGVLSIAGMAIYLLLVPAATAWIRLTILGPPEDGRFEIWRYGGEEWTYLGYFLLLNVFAFGVVFVGIVISVILQFVSPLLLGIAVPATIVAMAYVFGRLTPLLGSAAMGDGMTLGEAWRMSKPHGARITVANVIVMVLLITAQSVVLGLMVGVAASGAIMDLSTLEGGGPTDPTRFMEAFGTATLGLTAVSTVLLIMSVVVYAVFIGRIYAFVADSSEEAAVDVFD